jgi:cytochrome P450
MDGAEAGGEIAFDHHAADFAATNVAQYRELRGRCPVAHTANYGGFWVLSRYDDIFRVARDDVTFSSARDVIVPAGAAGRLIPLQCDPPDLERYRRILGPYFAPPAVKALEPFVRLVADRAIDAFVERGSADLVSEFATPLPSSTTMQMLGLDPAGWRTFAEPLHAASYSRPGTPKNLAALERIDAFTQLIVDEVDRRIAAPTGDMISGLLASSFEGRATTREETIDLVRMVIFGGMDTVMASLSNLFVQLGHRPDVRARLQTDRGLIPGAIEESLRFDAPVQGFARTVTADVEIGGRRIAKGETIFLLWASANRDQATFGPAADEFDIERFPNRHMTFGIGGHRCLGAMLARMEMQVALERLFDRIPDFAVQLEAVVEPETVGIVFGRLAVPVTFTPRQRGDHARAQAS